MEFLLPVNMEGPVKWLGKDSNIHPWRMVGERCPPPHRYRGFINSREPELASHTVLLENAQR